MTINDRIEPHLEKNLIKISPDDWADTDLVISENYYRRLAKIWEIAQRNKILSVLGLVDLFLLWLNQVPNRYIQQTLESIKNLWVLEEHPQIIDSLNMISGVWFWCTALAIWALLIRGVSNNSKKIAKLTNSNLDMESSQE